MVQGLVGDGERDGADFVGCVYIHLIEFLVCRYCREVDHVGCEH